MPVNCGSQGRIPKLFQEVKGPSQTADLVNQVNGIIHRIGIEVGPVFEHWHLTRTC